MLKIAWTDAYVLPLSPGHRFPMSKYEVLPQQLIHEGTITAENLVACGSVDERWILNVHEREYWTKLQTLSLTQQEVRRTGFPMSHDLIRRETVIAQGTLMSAVHALTDGIAMNIAGGTHHAFTNRGEGYCLLNDNAIAAAYLLASGLAKKILIVDLDVHQGNGTAQIFRDEPRVFTFSMHGANNYPMVKENSDLDIGLGDGTSDDLYLRTLEANLSMLLDQVQPDFIFFQAGVDILDTDKLGRLSVTRAGCKERDRMVLAAGYRNKIPLVATMGGGYSEFRDIIEAHSNTFRLAQEIYF